MSHANHVNDSDPQPLSRVNKEVSGHFITRGSCSFCECWHWKNAESPCVVWKSLQHDGWILPVSQTWPYESCFNDRLIRSTGIRCGANGSRSQLWYRQSESDLSLKCSFDSREFKNNKWAQKATYSFISHHISVSFKGLSAHLFFFAVSVSPKQTVIDLDVLTFGV